MTMEDRNGAKAGKGANTRAAVKTEVKDDM